jgi:hypothetical protein
MGVSLVKGSHTLDYDASKNNKDWVIPEPPTYVHDARVLPWPIKDGTYELAVALRVFHHLRPFQRQCFAEAKRIADALIIVVPDKSIHPAGIDRTDLVEWNDGHEPCREQRFSGELGTGYLFKWR